MEIKKHLVAATLAVGLSASATAMAASHEVGLAPSAKVGFILAYKLNKGSTTPVARMGEAAATAAGGALATSAWHTWAGRSVDRSAPSSSALSASLPAPLRARPDRRAMGPASALRLTVRATRSAGHVPVFATRP